jgi:hypothetical protein
MILFTGCSNLERKAYTAVERVKGLPSVFDAIVGAGDGSDVGAPTRELADGWVETVPGKKGTPITEADIASLPEPAQRYFRFANVVGKERIGSFSLVIEGKIRNDRNSEWMPLVMRQYNRIDNPSRIVYIESPGKPMSGIDSYVEDSGRMLIKIANIVTIADQSGPEMADSALVTFVNDLIMCPVAYFSLPVRWKEIDENRVALSLTNAGRTINAVLTVDSDGQLVDWKTNDRYAAVGGKNVKDVWSTPCSGSFELAGLRIPSKGQGIHDYDGSPFAYVELERISALKLDADTIPDRLPKDAE